jgi:hypothetical protein
MANPRPEEGFQEQKRKRRSSEADDRPDSAKKQETRPTQITTTLNFFAPLREMEMDAAPETGGDEEKSETPQSLGRTDLPLSQVNLLQFQKEIKSITKGSFELRNTKNGTRVISREITDYLAIRTNKKKEDPLLHLPPKIREAN